MTEHVIRYVVTHIGKDGLRTLCGPAQGRATKATSEEAETLMANMMKNNRMDGDRLAGVYGLPLEVRPVKCYPGHFDPMGVYFEDTEAQPAKDVPENGWGINPAALEVVIDIARTIGERRFVSDGDGRDDWRDMCRWANEFQEKFEANPDAGETYIEDIEQFAIDKAIDAGWTVCEVHVASLAPDRPRGA